jgi:hypothetical protein
MTDGSVFKDGSAESSYTPSGSPDIYPDKMSVNTELGFSVVQYEGNLNSTQSNPGTSVPHGLGVPPELVIFKCTSHTIQWHVRVPSLGKSTVLYLNTSDDLDNLESTYPTGQPDSNVFYTNYLSAENVNGRDYIAYCFASKRGVSKVGSYEGNFSSTGVKVYTGFEPAFIMFKPVDAATSWSIHDNQRGVDKQLRSDGNNYESTGWSSHLEFHRDGFKVKGSSSGLNPASTMFYVAFAKNTNETELATTSSGVWSGFQNAVTSITSTSTHPSLAPGTADTATTASIFDTVTAFGWGNNGTAEANNEMVITLDAAKSVSGFAVYEKYSSGYKYTGTTKLYGSTDNSNWYLLGSTVQNTTIERNRNETTFAASPEYQYYKFTLSANTRGTYQIAWAFELIADFDVTPSLHLDPASYSGTGTTWTADTGNNGTLVGNTSYDQELGDFFDLDGSGDYISLNSSGYLTGDFTVEMWWNFDTLSGFKMLWGGQGYSGGTGLGHYINGDTLFTYISVNGAAVSPTGQSGAVLTAGKWHHIVLTRSGDTYTQYVDGANVGSGTGSTASLESANTYIGAHYNNTAYNVDGRVGQVRVYSSALTQDKIRQNFNFTKNDYPDGFNGDINDATWNSSGYFDFDGISDYVTVNTTTNTPIDASNDFSIETWANPTTLGATRQIITKYGSSDSTRAFTLGVLTDGKVNATLRSGSTSINTQTAAGVVTTSGGWYHLVLVREGSDIKIYVNGNLSVSNSSSSTINKGGTQPIRIGAQGDGTSNEFLGKISKVKAYNTALTQAKVTALYNEGQ